eukprot:TRINITY_DN1044_c0_g1_i1.p1 TRINITY_DN1044_c0_g1~~TRINITY_DN1044_c0_g1_i1.p1  ORF type:complete len:473 (-),score=109.79 TRINITY_DN1044_c0_g1_i1:524-1942(-)
MFGSSSSSSASDGLDWKYAQVFGDNRVGAQELASEADIISTVEFDTTGDYIATGDKGGRVVVFERFALSDKSQTSFAGMRDAKKPVLTTKNSEYRFYTQFQSHEAEFDYLKSLEIEEKINKIKWWKPCSNKHMMLTTNDKTIKLWKIGDKKVKQISQTNMEQARGVPSKINTPSMLRIPRVVVSDQTVMSNPSRTYANGHAYHINSISINSDGEHYLSADDLRINLWNQQITNQSFNIVDIKPPNMEDLTEVITAAEFHPQHCNLFMYSSSKGSIKLGDMRQAALCDHHSKVFEEEEDPSNKSFFSEIISSISDVKFSRDGRFILSRDYMTLKIWDVNMESRPVKTIQIHENLRSKLGDLYENDFIFDKFECCFSGDGNYVLTGSYHNLFHVYDRSGRSDCCIEASKVPPKKKPTTKSKLGIGRSKKDVKARDDLISVDQMDFNKKALHLSWHPTQNIVVVAALNHLYLYSA